MAGIKRTMQHIEGEVRLEVPDIDWISDDPDVNMHNDQIRQAVEDACRNWHKQISEALETLQKKTVQVGPTASVPFEVLWFNDLSCCNKNDRGPSCGWLDFFM